MVDTMARYKDYSVYQKDEFYKTLEDGDMNQDILPYFKRETITIDENYKYLPDTRFRKFLSLLIRASTALISYCFTKCKHAYKVKGKENLKMLKEEGTISISNHVLHTDNMILRSSVYPHKKMYWVASPKNMVKGFGGQFLKYGGVLPLSTNMKALKNFSEAIEQLMQKKRLVHFYPEQSLWPYYKKPRPFKSGAFYYAVKFNVPVLPIFLTFKKSGWFRRMFGVKYKITANIMQAIYPNNEIESMQKRIEDLKVRSQNAFNECYEKTYNQSNDEKDEGMK